MPFPEPLFGCGAAPGRHADEAVTIPSAGASPADGRPVGLSRNRLRRDADVPIG